MADHIDLCAADDVPRDSGIVVRAGGHDFAVFNVAGEFRVLDNACPHSGGPLGRGTLVAGMVTCPWHFSAFDVRTGECLDPLGRGDVRSYRTFVEKGRVRIAREELEGG